MSSILYSSYLSICINKLDLVSNPDPRTVVTAEVGWKVGGKVSLLDRI